MGYWLAPTGQVDVAAICPVPRILVALIMFAFRFAFIIKAAYARLAKIVDGSPNKIADYIRLIVHARPVNERVVRVRFCLHHHPRRHSFMIRRAFLHHIVVTDNVVRRRQRVVDFPIGIP